MKKQLNFAKTFDDNAYALKKQVLFWYVKKE